MDKLQQYVKEATQSIDIAYHLLTRTYPLAEDSKILLSVLKSIYTSHEKIFLAVLDNEFLRPKISPTASFIIKYDRFKQLVLEKKLLEKEELSVFKEIEQLWNEHKESTVEFTKDNNVIMADEDFKIQKLSEEQLKKYISQTRVILKKLFKV